MAMTNSLNSRLSRLKLRATLAFGRHCENYRRCSKFSVHSFAVDVGRPVGILLSAVLISGCSDREFSFRHQRSMYEGMGEHVTELQKQNTSREMADEGGSGLLVIFDTSARQVKPALTSKGRTAEEAMRAIVARSTSPCGPNGEELAIAAFASPATVPLPITFVRCSVLAAEIRERTATADSLRRLSGLLEKQAQINNAERQIIRSLVAGMARDGRRIEGSTLR